MKILDMHNQLKEQQGNGLVRSLKELLLYETLNTIVFI